MIPDELVTRFNVKKTHAVKRGEYMFAYGFPCFILNLKYSQEEKMIIIDCLDIFTSKPHCVKISNAQMLMTFTPERILHKVLAVFPDGVLTDTEDQFLAYCKDLHVGIIPLVAGDIIQTVAAPACLLKSTLMEWAVNRTIEKIMKGSPMTSTQTCTMGLPE